MSATIKHEACFLLIGYVTAIMFSRRAITLLLVSLVYACSSDGGDGNDGGDSGSSNNQTACTTVHIVNLAQDSKSGLSCALETSDEKIANCVEEEITDAFDSACLGAFDVFVPGTNDENGSWKHFNSMFSRDTGRAYLSLQYQEEPKGALYDQGVIDGNNALKSLLYTLRNRFNNADVRIFGHSKGSHIVALVADESDYANMDFFAFAQAGRTSVDIDGIGGLSKGKRGLAGYIHKLSSNLVGITWQNDEVQYYTGVGTNGVLFAPEKWEFPGYVSQDTAGGLLINALFKNFRIDHHTNYGGQFTEGLSQNDIALGEGSTDPRHPYCATGDKFSWLNPECGLQQVKNFPYFWGNEECRQLAFEAMDIRNTGDRYYIGNSGPRTAGCSDNVGTVQARYRLDYRLDLADQEDCRYDLKLEFQGLNFAGQPYIRGNGGTISVSSAYDTGWTYKTGTVNIPYHTKIYVTAKMVEIGSGILHDCGHLTNASESYINKLSVTFTHPGSGERITRTLIGLNEASSYNIFGVKITGKNDVAWEKYNDPNDSKDTWDMFYHSDILHPSVMIKGDTDENRKGYFYKRLHLID